MQANDLCPSPHLEAADVADGDKSVTIRAVDFHEVGEQKVEKGVVFFEEFKRAMVLNRTNLKRIIALYGNDTDQWLGKRLTLYASETDWQGQVVPCLRIRDAAPRANEDSPQTKAKRCTSGKSPSRPVGTSEMCTKKRKKQ